jgi:branched-chain amino acid transport system permease protein
MSTFAQLSASGIALGCLYALVSLSFVLIMKATGFFNLLPGAFVLLGAYLTYTAHIIWGLPFAFAIVLAIVVCSVLGIAAQRYLFAKASAVGGRHGAGMFAVLLIGIGTLTIVEALVVSTWGAMTLNLNDPWGLRTITLAGASITLRDVWVVGLCSILLLGFWLLVQRTKVGVAMRAMATDSEAARSLGISPNLISAVAWTCAAAAAVVAGAMFATEVGGGAMPTLGQVAFAALPALILGGADSLFGCVAGGVTLGLIQTYAAGYSNEAFGQGFASTLPWILLILILLIKPTGLFGSREIRRA